ncbi:chemotaxis protein CheA [Sphingomonas montanisoli]|uniref:Chemotaxis protein CheA n=1 Tax=Sphingomonas montanisoli TaxID=2606412 RepID=A0A5D9C4R4_9SPHN|nr:chemotaxis protein CheA [Sphingomonas montanisoli]TZG26202.1 chemotaxis protein CheA [Sphingomonas montanisoli]
MKLEEIQDIFFQECDEGLGQAEAGLLALQGGAQDDETVNTVFRAVHSIKGGSGAFGFERLQAYTHHFETLLDQLREGEHALTPGLIGLLLAAFDMLADHVAAARGDQPTPDDAGMLQRLQETASGAGAAIEVVDDTGLAAALDFDLDGLLGDLDTGEDPFADWERDTAEDEHIDATRLFVRPREGALAHGGEPLLLIRELVDMGGIIRAVDASAVPTIDRFDATGAYLGWHVDVPATVARSDIEEIFEFVADDCLLEFKGNAAPVVEAIVEDGAIAEVEPAIEPAPLTNVLPFVAPAEPAKADMAPAELPASATQSMTATIRVDLEKLDRLINLVGELVITQAMLAQRLHNSGLAQIEELNDLDHLTRELQDSAMSIRAQPIRSVFSRVPRIIREVTASTGKEVRLEVEGEATELDKTVVERIGEPLTHLIRNAIDHGLESPEERLAAGKSAEGRIRLTAEHRSGRIVICVSDDGRGIDRPRVLAKAIERGLVAPEARLSDEDIDNLIFSPGFSTAATVSNISGRGVGMDVVRRNVQALGGRITIASTPGKGTTFTLALPLTLAILDGMIVTVGAETYVIPLTHIIESVQPEPEDIKYIGANQPMISVRGSWLPVQSVANQFAIPGAQVDPAKAVLIVVESEAAGQAVLMVDEICDQRQVVIKSLETNYRQVEGLAGATILGDGRVALILDVEGVTTVRAPDRALRRA